MAKKEATGALAIRQQEKLDRLHAYGKAAKGSGASNIVGTLLKFNKGEFTIGKDGEEVELGTKLVFNPESVLTGWTRWEDNKPIEFDMGPLIDGFQPKPRSQLGLTDQSEWETFDDGKPKDPWTFGNTMLFRTIGKKPEIYTFITGSAGGIQAIGSLIVEYAQAAKEGRSDEYPIVEIGKDFYMHKNKAYGKIWVPTFEIVGWQAIDDNWTAAAEEAPAKKPAAKGKQKSLTY